MNPATLHAFSDELQKIAALGGLRGLWQTFLDTFRSGDEKTTRRVEYHFSPAAGPDRWRKFIRNVQDPAFLKQVAKHPDADEKLVLHAQSMHDLSRGETVDKIQSGRLPGRTYEVRKTSGGLACTCPDWRYKGSVTPGYECKHIRAHRKGKLKAD